MQLVTDLWAFSGSADEWIERAYVLVRYGPGRLLLPVYNRRPKISPHAVLPL